MLALILIVMGILLRLVPHAPNFTPIAAIALFSGAYLNKRSALVVPLLLMIISDSIVGLHNVIFFTWGSFILITLLGFWVKKQKSASRVVVMSLVSSLLFYVITNFGVWFMGWYPHTLKGLIACYIMGLPFLRNFALATILYAALFFVIYEFIARSIKEKRLSKVLLTEF